MTARSRLKFMKFLDLVRDEIEFAWVPGQVGIRSSLEVDFIAKDAQDADISDVLVHFSDLKLPFNK